MNHRLANKYSRIQLHCRWTRLPSAGFGSESVSITHFISQQSWDQVFVWNQQRSGQTTAVTSTFSLQLLDLIISASPTCKNEYMHPLPVCGCAQWVLSENSSLTTPVPACIRADWWGHSRVPGLLTPKLLASSLRCNSCLPWLRSNPPLIRQQKWRRAGVTRFLLPSALLGALPWLLSPPGSFVFV